MTCKRIASGESWTEFSKNMGSEQGSDAQMPVFQVIMFGWDKVCGETERGFRLLNVIFWLIGVAAISYFLKLRGKPTWGVIMAAGTSSFLWYYMDEARPYALQFAGASCLLVGYWIIIFEQKVPRFCSWGFLLLGTLMCAGSSLLAAPFAGLIFLCVTYDQWKKRVWYQRSEMVWFMGWCLLLASLTLYYVWTLFEGKGASSVNKTSALTLGFSVFEQLGFMPYGPGRQALRSEGVSSLAPWVFALAGWAVAMGAALLVGGDRVFRGGLFKPAIVRALLPVVAMVVILVVAGYFGGFRVIGRHFMPVYPILLIITGLAYVKLWSGNILQRGITFIIPMIALIGCLTQRYAERHHKDDYRGAVGHVNFVSKDGSPVWWAAAKPSYAFEDSVELHDTRNINNESLHKLPIPTVIVLSKTDLYDARGALRKWIVEHDYQITKELPAFKFYQRRVVE